MSVNVIGQGGQNSIDTISNSLTSSNIETKEVLVMPILNNYDTSGEMQHGEENFKETNEKNIKNAVDKLNKFLQGEATCIEYERHDQLKREFIIRIINKTTKEVIKEIPPKKILDMVAEMYKLAGIILDKKA